MLFYIAVLVVIAPAQIATNLAIDHKDAPNASLYDAMADAFTEKEMHDSALFYLQKSKEDLEKSGVKIRIADNLHRLALNSNKRSEFDKAMQYDFQSLAIREDLKDDIGIAKSYTNLAMDFYYNNDFTSGASYGEKAVKYSRSVPDSALLAQALHGTASNYLWLEEFPKALNLIGEAVEIKQKLFPDQYTTLSSMNAKGNVLKLMGNYRDALSTYRHALSIGEKINAKRGTSTFLANIGHTLILLKDYKNALPYTLKAIDIMHEISFITNLPENYQHASTSYEQLGDFRMALEYQKKYQVMQDSLFSLDRNKTMEELQTKYETSKKESLLALKDQEIHQQRKVQWLIAGIAALLAGLLFAAYRSYMIRSRTNRQLAEVNQKLGVKNTQNELLLKEIHHRVKNNLEIVSGLLELQAAQIDHPTAQAVMQSSQNRVQSMGIIHQKLYQKDNLAAIEMKDYFINLTESILDTFNATDRVTMTCRMDPIELDVDTAVPIGLIANELLTNALKYAFDADAPGQITIGLEPTGVSHQLLFYVADNGRGMAPHEKPKGTGFGTDLVHLLVKQLEGQLSYDYHQGTKILLYFNIKSKS